MAIQTALRTDTERRFGPEERYSEDRGYAISVVIPTYKRPHDLARCLSALERQERLPDSVIVVVRDSDAETRRFLYERRSDFSPTVVYVKRGGLVPALNAGLDAADCDVVAFTDDDARPHTDWLAKIERHFATDTTLGGVGGRDFVRGLENERETERVGVVQWFGRPIGNHHLGTGPARDVDVLKGVNMSFRRAAVGSVRFDERLRGTGAQTHNELGFCFAISERGWRLCYDPAVAVDHFPAERADGLGRTSKTREALRNDAFNQTLSLLEHLGPLRGTAFAAWAFAAGSRDLPGLAQCLRPSLWKHAPWTSLRAVFAGRFEALKTVLRKRRVLIVK